MEFIDVVDDELEPIRILLCEVPPFLAKRREEIRAEVPDPPRGYRGGTADFRIAAAVFLESMLSQLNASVDGGILALYISVLPAPHVNRKALHHDRAKMLAHFRSVLGVDEATLPGWEGVERVRNMSNALKHRVGLAFSDIEGGGLAFQDVRLSTSDVEALLADVRRWLVALAKVVLKTSASDDVA